jgi:hypothetical protein
VAIEILSGSPTIPTLIPLAGAGDKTYVVEASEAALVGAQLPGSNGKGVELTFICLSAFGLVLFPWGTDTIKLADLTSGDGTDTGCIACSDAVCVVRLRAVTGGWAAVGVLGVWEVRAAYTFASPVRGSVRGGYRQVLIDAASLTGGGLSAVAPAADPLGLSFANGADQDKSCRFVMPADWQFEGDVALHLYWCKTNSAAGAVKWQARYRIAKPGAGALTAFSAWADFSSTVAADGDTQDRLAVVRFADVDMAATEEGTIIVFDVRRKGADAADTYAAPAVLIQVGLQYPADVIGWRAAFAK